MIIFLCGEARCQEFQSRTEKQRGGRPLLCLERLGPPWGGAPSHWPGARSSSGGSSFQEEEGSSSTQGELSLEERSPWPRNGSGASQVCGQPVHSFLPGFPTFPVLSLAVSPEMRENYQLDHLLTLGFLLHLKRHFLTPG